ncbi:ion transporter [Roseimaritima ulvae]|uniref:Cyclic nucleotide-gated potassium channel n=1 Tax=Roseimaritima ulvae TaxID=980254 RepID=A0A5B9R066_9BACT|nr:ion transporter [Roseimaritima ulvae]QEG43762.1 Cyclic nucleotide-gated potassium channel [Roseimaritima ulvae]
MVQSGLEKLRRIIEENDTIAGRAFDLGIQALIFVSLLAFSIETLPELPAGLRPWLRRTEVVTVTLFTAEYVTRLIVARNKFGFMFSFFGVVDLLAILPFYLALGFDLRSMRALRLLRVFRVLKLVRYSQAMQRIHHALLIAWEELVLYMFMTFILLYLAAVGIYYCERDAQPEAFASVFHSLWWAVVTLTTVGYGDVYPVTVGGRMFTFALLLIGLGVVAVPAGLVASALSKARELESEPQPERQTQTEPTNSDH